MPDETPNTLGLTPFGAALQEIMHSRGVTSWAELAELLSEGGYPVTEQEIRQWVHHAPPDILRISEDR